MNDIVKLNDVENSIIMIRGIQVILDSDLAALYKVDTKMVGKLSNTKDQFKQKSLIQQGSEIISDLLDDSMQVSNTETTIELNFAVVKLKHVVQRKGKSTE